MTQAAKQDCQEKLRTKMGSKDVLMQDGTTIQRHTNLGMLVVGKQTRQHGAVVHRIRQLDRTQLSHLRPTHPGHLGR